MTYKVKDLSVVQKMAVESLLGRPVTEDEEIIIRATASPAAPEWLESSWKNAQDQDLNHLSMEEIDAEIAAARRARRDSRPVER